MPRPSGERDQDATQRGEPGRAQLALGDEHVEGAFRVGGRPEVAAAAGAVLDRRRRGRRTPRARRPGVTWASPKDRTPGVSTTQPRPSGSGRAMAATVVWRPLPTADTTPVARAASGTSLLTSVDLPTPECPTSAETRPSSRSASASGGWSRRVTTTGSSSSRYDAANGSGSPRSALVRHSTGARPPAYAATRHRSTKPAPRHRVGHGRDDDELLGVGDHQPLDGVGVVGGAAQHGACAPRRGRCGRACPVRRTGRRPARPGRPRRSACGPARGPASR